MNKIFVFNGEGAKYPCGVFLEYLLAEEWIKKHALTGILTEFPVNTGLYDWAIEKGFFEPKKDYQTSSKFIQNFSSASLEHYHFENGILLG